MASRLLSFSVVGASLLFSGPAHAAGVVLITQAKAGAGNVTDGDKPGFPVTISESGSYRLASNLQVPAGKDGIVVKAPDVTIDLDGFEISGGSAGGSSNGRRGIFGKSDRLTIKGGTIGAFSKSGIYAPTHPYLIVENMRVVNGGGLGIVAGDFARIQNSTIALNQTGGVSCAKSCHLEGSIVSNNGGIGISILTGLLLGNTVFSNTSYGVKAGSFTGQNTGLGNNAISDNYGGSGVQITGSVVSLQANLCGDVAC